MQEAQNIASFELHHGGQSRLSAPVRVSSNKELAMRLTTLIPERACVRFWSTCLVVVILGIVAGRLSAQPADPNQSHAAHPQAGATAGAPKPDDLRDQVAQLRAEVAKLQAALQQQHGGAQAGQMGRGMGMGGMGPRGAAMAPGSAGGGMPGGGAGMGMMGMMNEMGGMSGQPGGGGGKGMGMMEGMMGKGMSMMGQMGGGGMAMPSALPGFPGASHIYHIGSSDFYLNHSDHIRLSADQQRSLNQIKEKASMDQATLDRKIEEGEQELWKLTASDTPDAGKIEGKVREIEKARGDKRLGFIRAVGEAAKVLTDQQRSALLGNSVSAEPPAAQPAMPAAPGGMGGGGMGDM